LNYISPVTAVDEAVSKRRYAADAEWNWQPN